MKISKHFETVLENLKKVSTEKPKTQDIKTLNKDDTEEVTYSIDTSGPAAKVDNEVKVVKKGAAIPKEKFIKCCEGIIGHFERQLTLARLAGLDHKIQPITYRINEMHGMCTKYREEEEIRFQPPENLPVDAEQSMVGGPEVNADSMAQDMPTEPIAATEPDIDIGQIVADVLNLMRDDPEMRAVDAFAQVLAQCTAGDAPSDDVGAQVDPTMSDIGSVDDSAGIPPEDENGDITLDIRPQ